MPNRVIVDENAGPGTRIWQQFQQTAGDEPQEYTFLGQSHRGIPDVEILDKLLLPGVVLLTGDCVLHMQALKQGRRSYTLNDQGQLTRKPLLHVGKTKPLPKSVHSSLQADYVQQPTHDLAQRLKTDLTERQFKRYRTARRRIRSHFGSADAISQVSVTVSSLPTARGLLCGFAFHAAGSSGVKGLRASEGYCLAKGKTRQDAACTLLHALRTQYVLQLDQVRTDLFIIPQASLELARLLNACQHSASEPAHETLRQVLQGLVNLKLHPCVKGPFYDAMQAKLKQLNRGHSNEVISFDVDSLANSFLAADQCGGETASE